MPKTNGEFPKMNSKTFTQDKREHRERKQRDRQRSGKPRPCFVTIVDWKS
jgi:hypothetical protein